MENDEKFIIVNTTCSVRFFRLFTGAFRFWFSQDLSSVPTLFSFLWLLSLTYNRFGLPTRWSAPPSFRHKYSEGDAP
jgi:hypothetical protein